MGKYTSKYTGAEIDAKLDAVANPGLIVLDLSGALSGTLTSEQLTAIKAAPQNYILKTGSAGSKVNMFSLG